MIAQRVVWGRRQSGGDREVATMFAPFWRLVRPIRLITVINGSAKLSIITYSAHNEIRNPKRPDGFQPGKHSASVSAPPKVVTDEDSFISTDSKCVLQDGFSSGCCWKPCDRLMLKKRVACLTAMYSSVYPQGDDEELKPILCGHAMHDMSSGAGHLTERNGLTLVTTERSTAISRPTKAVGLIAKWASC